MLLLAAMPRTSLKFLFAAVLQLNAEDRADILVDKLVQKLANDLFGSAVGTPFRTNVDLVNTTFGRPGYAIAARTKRNFLARFVDQQPISRAKPLRSTGYRAPEEVQRRLPASFANRRASDTCRAVVEVLNDPVTRQPLDEALKLRMEETQEIAAARSQLRNMEENILRVRHDTELKTFFDHLGQLGPVDAMKYYSDPEFWLTISARMGFTPNLRREEAQHVAALMVQSRDLLQKVSMLRNDVELNPYFEEIEKYYADPRFLRMVSERLGVVPEVVQKRAQWTATALEESGCMEKKINALVNDVELKSFFDRVQELDPASAMKYYSDPFLLCMLGERLNTLGECTPAGNRTAVREADAAVDDTLSREISAKSVAGSERATGTLLTLAMTFLWASNFPAVKAVIDAGLPTSAQAASRFSIAAVALLPLLFGQKTLPAELVRGSVETGVLIAVGYIGQALALHDLPAGAVAFICSLQVVFVPIAQTLLGGTLTSRLALSALLCISGVGFLELAGMGNPVGDATGASHPSLIGPTLLAFLQPAGFGASYLRVEGLMRKFPEHGLQTSALQLVANAAVAIAWFVMDSTLNSQGTPGGGAVGGGFDFGLFQQPHILGSLIYTGLVSTALTIPMQMSAQRMLPATDFAVIVGTEPLWAALLAAVFLSEQPDSSTLIGGSLIMLGCLSNSLLPADLGVKMSRKGESEAERAGSRTPFDQLFRGARSGL